MKDLVSLLVLFAAIPAFGAYDPLVPTGNFTTEKVTFQDGTRDVPTKIYLPTSSVSESPVVLFSHGLGGSNEGSAFLGEHWASRGYVAVFLQHPGSDEDVWMGKPPKQAYRALVEAADVANFLSRIEDVKTVLAGLEAENADPASSLFGRLNLAVIGMSGHSFGAITTQAVSGQKFVGGTTYQIPEIKAAIPMSPSPSDITSPSKSFGSVSIPWLCMTGTEDSSPPGLGSLTPADRRKVYAALPATGSMYELVLFGATHFAFTDDDLAGRTRNPNHHRAILATSTAFWDAYLNNRKEAVAWLKTQARKVLQRKDTLRWK